MVAALLLCGGAVKVTNFSYTHCTQESENSLSVALQILRTNQKDSQKIT